MCELYAVLKSFPLLMRIHSLLVTLICVSGIHAATSFPQIPSLTTFNENKHDPGFKLSSHTEIVVDAQFAHLKADKYSPSLLDYAHTFNNDLSEITGQALLHVRTESEKNARRQSNSIYLTVLSQRQARNYKYNNGNVTDEAYELDINHDMIIISGSSAIGAFWGTRSVLQQVVINQKQHDSAYIVLPAGSGVDVPGWEVRGFM